MLYYLVHDADFQYPNLVPIFVRARRVPPGAATTGLTLTLVMGSQSEAAVGPGPGSLHFNALASVQQILSLCL